MVSRSGGIVVGVVGVAVELGQVGEQPPGPPPPAQRVEGRGVALGLGEEVAAEAEHVRPAPQVQPVVAGQAAELPRGGDHAAVVVADPQVLDVGDVADRPVGALGWRRCLWWRTWRCSRPGRRR